MGIQIVASGADMLADGVWTFDMPPHQVRYLGNTVQSLGARSVLLLKACAYDETAKKLTFDIEDALPINVGTTSKVLGLSERAAVSPNVGASDSTVRDAELASGDREFLRLARQELSATMAAVAEQLLFGVRDRFAGELKRGQTRNFSETPDNFWYVIIQPRVDEISVTVRGSVQHFSDIARLQIKDDRGNTRFKVRSEQDVPAALQLIFHALRKR